ncbi:MAG: ion transporter [Gemmatales bacterium]|nr:ion transporter [Gemmatales bacterium]
MGKNGGLTQLASWQHRVWRTLQVEKPEDPWTRGLVSFLTVLIIASVATVVLETVSWLAERFAIWFLTIEVIAVAIFTVEYFARLWTCTQAPRYSHPLFGRLLFVVTPMAILDLLAILPFYLMFFVENVGDLRMLMLLRMARLAKLGRYSTSAQVMVRALRRCREELVVTLGLMFLLILISATLVYLAEHHVQPDKFPDIPSAMWWSVITLTTVGYGDVYPVTPLGRFFAALSAIFGVGMVALPTGILGASFLEELRASRQAQGKKCPHCGQPLD